MFCIKVCTVLSSAQFMAKDVGQGSDMQGTPPRDLRGFRICFCFCLCSYLWYVSVCLLLSGHKNLCNTTGIFTHVKHIFYLIFKGMTTLNNRSEIWKDNWDRPFRDLSSKKWSVLLQLLIFLSHVPAECLLASADSGLTGPAVCCSS